MRTTIAAGLLVVACAALGGCGFISAGGKSPVKPSSFVITGDAQIPLVASSGLTLGGPCSAPSGASDVVTGAPVIVSAPGGAKVASSTLGPGVVSGSESAPVCTFPFEVWNVPGGHDSYDIAIGDHAAQVFDGQALRAATPAVITITPAP